MTELDKMKMKAELLRVQAAKAELEFLVAQKMEEVQRLKEHIKKQDEAEIALKTKLAD